MKTSLASITTASADRLTEVWRGCRGDRSRIADYLLARGLPAEILDRIDAGALRLHPALPYFDGEGRHRGDFPAMVARVTDADGKSVTLHRTYLDPDGAGKLNLGDEPAKKLMTAVRDGASKGASIKLASAQSVLGLAEGIETALAVMTATGQPCWSCVSAGGLETVVLPPEVQGVHVWADNDASGRGLRAAERLAKRLYQENRAVYVHPPSRVGSDWLDVYVESGANLIMNELTTAPPWSPFASVGVVLSTVTPERVEWLWSNRLPLGKVTVLDGDPGLGKSTLTLDIAARTSTGRSMPDGSGGDEPAGVVIVSAEDGLADTIVPRLIAAGGALDKIVAIDKVPDDEGGHPFVIPDDLPAVERAIREMDAKLVIIDPLMAFLSGTTNSHRDQDVRRALARVHDVAEHYGAAILVVRHLNKTSGGPAVYRGGGSIGIIGAARSGLLVARDPENDDRRILASVKSNLCVSPESLAFHLESSDNGVARVVWDGTSSHKADALLALPTDGDERHEADEARDFLLDALSDGARSAKTILSDAREAGISEKRLRRAKNALGVSSQKESMAGGWVWSLPKMPEDGRRRPYSECGHLRPSSEEVGHLREPEHDPLPAPEVVTI